MSYNVSTDNSFVPLLSEEMAGDGFQTVKRKRNNTGYGEERVSQFMDSSTTDKLNLIFNELQMIRGSQEQTNRHMLNFQQSYRLVNDKLCEVIDVTNKNTNVLKTLAYKSIDLEARSRRNNLLFWGLIENPHENCFHIILDFIHRHLDLDAGNMYLARAHRLGPRRIGQRNPKRPIIVNFRDFCDTELIMSRANMLKNTPFSVGFDLPKEINEARKKLWAELKSIRSTQPRVKFQILYPAKLIVEGKLVRDEFPDWGNALYTCRSRTADFSHIYRNFSFDQPNNQSNTDELPTRDQYLYTNTLSKTVLDHPKEARGNLNMQMGRVVTSSDDQYMEHESSVSRVNSPSSSEMNSDLPFGGDSSVIIHEALVHSTNDEQTLSSSQGIFRPYDIDSTITEQNIDGKGQSHASNERLSRSLTRTADKRKCSLSVSRARCASHDLSGGKPVHSKNSRTRQNMPCQNNGNTDSSQNNQGATSGTPDENVTDGISFMKIMYVCISCLNLTLSFMPSFIYMLYPHGLNSLLEF